MKIFKKITVLLLAFCMLVCISACGGNKTETGSNEGGREFADGTGEVIKAKFSNTESPEGYPILDDDLTDMAKIHDTNMTGLISINYAAAIGDTHRFSPAYSEEGKKTGNYITYYLEKGFIDYCVLSYRYDGEGETEWSGIIESNLKIFISKDGSAWDEHQYNLETTNAADSNWKWLWYKGEKIDPSYKYLKIEFPVAQRYYGLCVGRVRMNGTSYMMDPDANYENRASNTFYVDSVNGNDNNDGTSEDKAFKSLAKVSSKYYQAGDSILFKRGCKFSGSVTIKGHGDDKKDIYVGAYGEGKDPIIYGRGDYAVVVNAYSVTIENLEVTNPNGMVGIQVNPLIAGENKNVAIKNCNVHDIHTKISETTKLTRDEAGILFTSAGNEPSWFNGITVEGCTIKNVNSVGIEVFNNWNNNKELPTLWGSYSNSPHKNVTVRGNHLDTIGVDGIWVTNSHDVLIEKNTLYRGYQCTAANFDNCAGIWVINCENNLIQYNEVGYMDRKLGQIDGQAFDIDIGNKNTVLQYNYTHDNVGGFLLICSSAPLENTEASNAHTSDVIVRYNVSVRDRFFEGQQNQPIISLGDRVTDIEIYNNTFYMSGESRTLQPISSTYAFSNKMTSERVKVFNNIFHAESGITVDWNFSNSKNITFENNIYSGGAAVMSAKLKDGSSVSEKNPKKQNVSFKEVLPEKLDGRDVALKLALKEAVSGANKVKDNGGKDYNGKEIKSDFYGAVQ